MTGMMRIDDRKGNSMIFIGITGGVGAGKSAVLSYLKELDGVRVMLSDEIAHELMEPGSDCYNRLKELFAGEPIWLEDGHFDRVALAGVIFSDDKKRELLNEVVHPAVKEYVLHVLEQEKEEGRLRYLVLEAALLIEEHYDEICDELWYIYTSEENRRARLKQSRGYSDEKISDMFESQLCENEYRRHCKVVIDNNGTTEETIAQVRTIIENEGENTNG